MIKSLSVNALLQNLNPVKDKNSYVFAFSKNYLPAMINDSFAFIREAEGFTYITSTTIADQHHLTYQGEYCLIHLNVYSSLHECGLTAAVSAKLAKYHIPCNVIAGYNHDHMLIPISLAEQAMNVLAQLQSESTT